MFTTGARVCNRLNGAYGTVVSVEGANVQVHWDNGSEDSTPDYRNLLLLEEDEGAPSQSNDPVHSAMLRHARNAGAAVTALEIIYREAKTALKNEPDPDSYPSYLALQFIKSFSDDVLSSILPD
jgi:hypothetical protein